MANMKEKLKTPKKRLLKANLKSTDLNSTNKAKLIKYSSNVKRLRSSKYANDHFKDSKSDIKPFNELAGLSKNNSDILTSSKNKQTLNMNGRSSLKTITANKAKRNNRFDRALDIELTNCTNNLQKLLPKHTSKTLRSNRKSKDFKGSEVEKKTPAKEVKIETIAIPSFVTKLFHSSKKKGSSIFIDDNEMLRKEINKKVLTHPLTNGLEGAVMPFRPLQNSQRKKRNINNNIPFCEGPKSQNAKPLLVKHKNEINKHSKTQEDSKKKIQKSKPSERNNNCQVCLKPFQTREDLKKHLFIHLDISPYGCPHCEKRFRQAGNLRSHIISCHSALLETDKVFVCEHCRKPFTIKERLRLHLRIHTGEKPYSCPICQMKFRRTGEVKQHTRTHTRERRFQCKDCESFFSSKAKLLLHIKSHMGIRDYTCYLCGKSFIRPDAIKKHIKCTHFDERPFECPICNKKLKGHLREHMRTHVDLKPHTCRVCDAQFAQRSHLTVHERIHSGDRPYQCRICRRAFAHSSALSLHIRRHTGERPIACPICPAAFAQLPHMKKHMMNIHNERQPYMCKKCHLFYRTKTDLDSHSKGCSHENTNMMSLEEELSEKVSKAHAGVDPPMPLTRMRFLLAILLKKISSDSRLEVLGFNKRLIDEILIESLESSGHQPCKDETLHPAVRLKVNVQMLLDWTVPADFKEKFKSENRSTEELLEELTS